MRALVRISTGKAIQWRGPGHLVNRWTLKTGKLLSKSTSQKSAPRFCRFQPRFADFSRDLASKTREFFEKIKVAERTRNLLSECWKRVIRCSHSKPRESRKPREEPRDEYVKRNPLSGSRKRGVASFFCPSFCRTSKRRTRRFPEPPKLSKPPKPSWRLPPLNSTPLFREPDLIPVVRGSNGNNGNHEMKSLKTTTWSNSSVLVLQT